MEMKIGYLFGSAILIALSAHAAYVGTSTTRVALVSSYNQFGGGDVIFKIENPIPECIDGYWLTKTDPDYQTNLAMIVTSYHTKTLVVVYGLSDQLWSGSAGKYCKLYSFDLR
jgi:hypothetical protein